MKKEVLIAVVVGLCIGLMLTIVAYRARQRLNPQPTEVVDETLSASSTPQSSQLPESNPLLQIVVPADELISSEKEIVVTGKAPAESHVMVQNDTQAWSTIADAQGRFAVKVLLTVGGNELHIIALPSEGDPIEVVRSVSFFPGDLNEDVSLPSLTAPSPSPAPQGSATPKPATSPRPFPSSPV